MTNKQLKRYKKKNKLSNYDLALEIGVSEFSIRKYINNTDKLSDEIKFKIELWISENL